MKALNCAAALTVLAIAAGCGDSNQGGTSPANDADPTVYGGGDTNSKAAVSTDDDLATPVTPNSAGQKP